MEARLFQTNENNIFNFNFNPEDCLYPTVEQHDFIHTKSEDIKNYFSDKNKFDKENYTVYGLPVTITPFILNKREGESIHTRAVKVGYLYFIETVNDGNGWNLTGLTCEEIVDEIFNNEETQRFFDPKFLYFGFGLNGSYCDAVNIVRLYKEEQGKWTL